MSFLLATTFTDPNSSSFFMTDYEEGLYFSTANFAFHRNHFEDPPKFSSILISLQTARFFGYPYPVISIYKIFPSDY
jgi:hypothetical protein